MQVLIQKWKMEDAEKLQQLCDQADRRYLSDRLPHPYTLQNATEWIQYALQQEKAQKGIFRSIVVHHHIVGNISIERKEDVRCLEGEIGFLLDKTYWSNSITSKAVDLICKEAYKQLPLQRISALVYAPNIASRKVLEKNQFVLEGILRKAIFKDGKIYDACLYAHYRKETE